jgi:hypothetical protein
MQSTRKRLSLAELLSSLEASLAHFVGTSDRLVQHISRIDAYMHATVDFTFLIDPPTTEGNRRASEQYHHGLGHGEIPVDSSYAPVCVLYSTGTQTGADTHSHYLSTNPAIATGMFPLSNHIPLSPSQANNHRGLNSIQHCFYPTSLLPSGRLILARGPFLMRSLEADQIRPVWLLSRVVGSRRNERVFMSDL